MDSVVLLDLLHRLARDEGWRLRVAHFNHGLRATEADRDEAWVRALAARYGLPCIGGRAAVAREALAQGISREMAGRRLRHIFLARAARDWDAARVALGHQADDQAETVLLRLLRGSGGEGLGAMGWQSPSPADPGVMLVRPLLGTTRAAIERYARGSGLTWREDRSNADCRIPRNRVRRELVPFLRKRFQPALEAVLCRAADVVGAEADYVIGVAERWRARRVRTGFERLHPAVQRQVLRLELLALGIVPGFDCIEHLRTAAGTPWPVGSGRWVAHDGRGSAGWVEGSALGFASAERAIELAGRAGSVEFDGVQVRWHRVRRAGVDRLPPTAGQETFDAARVGRLVVLRHWRPGDRFQPCGMPAPARLQDLFTNAKVPRSERHRRLLGVTEAGEVFWVEGLRIGESSRVRPATRTWLIWRWERAPA
jgi:tRNA(Ile)-lysidine synthase